MKRKKNEQKREKRKHQEGTGAGKTKKERQKEAPVNEERKKQGHLVPASVLTPNTLCMLIRERLVLIMGVLDSVTPKI